VGTRLEANTVGPGRDVLAAIGTCPFAAMSGCSERATFVTECDRLLGPGRAGSLQSVRARGDAIGPGSHADGEIRPRLRDATVYRICR